MASYRGRLGQIFLPQNLVDIVVGVFGLDNRKMAEREPITMRARSPESAAAVVPLTPQQVAALYQFPPVPANGAIKDQVIGILEFAKTTIGFKQSDVDRFFNGEVVLDIDVAGAVTGKDGNIAVYFTTWDEKGWIDALTKALFPASANDPHPAVLSISWVHAEYYPGGTLAWTQAAMDSIDNLLQQAASLGVTVFAATGDRGSDCHVGDRYAHVMYPASSPWVIACGGTIISNANLHANTFTEKPWNDSSVRQTGVTGGGYSENSKHPFPSWQLDAGIPPPPNGKGRGIPDVAGNASARSGYKIWVNNAQLTCGGTSAVAPLYAGLLAIINATLARRVGWLNRTLYLNGGTSMFKDVTDATSNQDYSAPPAPSYKGGGGWDACTGWGSINGTVLKNKL
jgi:kumamolisin